MLKTSFKDGIFNLVLNRPDVRNALNAEFISLINGELKSLNSNDDVKVIIISGEGKSFSAGADLKWLKDVTEFSYDENYRDSKNFVELLNTINFHSKPIISKINGAAIGGGSGIALASDIIVASDKSIFGISEVAIGVIPAAIVHLVKERIGETKAREYLITGQRIKATQALELGMINYCVPDNELDQKTNELTTKIRQNSPSSVTKVKEMSRKVNTLSSDKLDHYISETIANLRTSDECREGISAFLEKRKPSWQK